MSRRPFHTVHESAEPSVAKSVSAQEEATTIAKANVPPELVPRLPVSPPTSPGPSEQPKLIIGRLSVEVVQSEPIARQPVQMRAPAQPSKAPPVHSTGYHTKLRFGLGQV
jgi:hypothetical protein